MSIPVSSLITPPSTPSPPSSPVSNDEVEKLKICDVKWDNDENHLRIFLPCKKSLDLRDVDYSFSFSDEDGSTKLTVTYLTKEFSIHTCKQIAPVLEAKVKDETLIIRLTKIYPNDHWSLMCSREYHPNGTVTLYINEFFKETLPLKHLKRYYPSSPLCNIENIILHQYYPLDIEYFDLLIQEMLDHEINDEAEDLGYVQL